MGGGGGVGEIIAQARPICGRLCAGTGQLDRQSQIYSYRSVSQNDWQIDKIGGIATVIAGDAHTEDISSGQATGVLHIDLDLGGAAPARGGIDGDVAIGGEGHARAHGRRVANGEGQVSVGVFSVGGVGPEVDGRIQAAVHGQ